MSSKSRKKKTVPATQPVRARKPAATDPAAPQAQAEHEKHELLEDFIEAPRGRSRVQQAVLVGLLIFLLVIFIVPTAIQGTCSPSGAEQQAFRFEEPDGDPVQVSVAELFGAKRLLADLTQSSDQSDVDVASWLILERVADEAGIAVSDDALRQQIQAIADQLGGPQGYKAYVSQRMNGVQEFESALRRAMRVDRLRRLMGALAAVPDPEAIEKLWNEQHKEHAFEYIEVPVADFVDEARAAEASDEELQAWLDARQPWEKERYQDPERYRVELVTFPAGSAGPPELLAAYGPKDLQPPADATPAGSESAADPAGEDAGGETPDQGEAETPAGEEPSSEPQAEDEAGAPEEPSAAEKLAHDYYNAVFFTRFVREDPESAPDASPYKTFEEVQAEALAEAPVYFAMQEWAADVRKRTGGGEAIDLAAEAGRLGLTYVPAGDALSREEWTTREGVGGVRLASEITRGEPGALLSRLSAEKGGFAFGRVIAKEPAVMPPFEDLRERLVEDRAKDKASELALAKLVEVSAAARALPASEGSEPALAETASSEAFAAASAAARYEVRRRDWLDRSAPLADDPEASLPAHVYLRSNPSLYELEAGRLSEPALGPQKEQAYLVRSEGWRTLDLARMKPQQYETYRRQSAQEALSSFLTSEKVGLTGLDELERRYGLEFNFEIERPEEAAEPLEGAPE